MFFLQIALFLTLFVLILGGSHYLLYLSIVRFFDVSDSQKTALIIVLAILAISFFFSSLLAHWKENALTRISYFLSGFWLGLATNLLLSVLLVWIIYWLGNLFGWAVDLKVAGASFFLLALVVSVWGVWNAYGPRVKNITITIPGLPENWKGKRVVQLSDVHLGLIHGPESARAIVDKTNALRPDLVLITGDLFDGMDGNLDALVAPLKNFQSTGGVFFVDGNHETYLGTDKAFAALQGTGILILRDQVADVDGLKLIGISYPERGSKKNVVDTLQELKAQFSGQPNILLYHAPTDIPAIARSGVNLQLSGHTHIGQLFPFNFVTKLIYHGYDYGLHRIGDYTLYTTSGTGTWGPMMRTDSRSEIVMITLE